jgi:hypothetical protein
MTTEQMWKEIRALHRAYREEAEEAGRGAYEREMENW